MVIEDTLQFKHFPDTLSDPEKEEFLFHFGATNVKVITSASVRRNSVAYAKFKSKEVARNVMCSLHQVKLLNSYLSVKYAEQHVAGLYDPKIRHLGDAAATPAPALEEQRKHFQAFVNQLHGFNTSVGFGQPPPPHLKYAYPRPNRATINNIAHAIASVPKFYVQVLHLMNRMNFPPPFAVNNPPAEAARQPVHSQIIAAAAQTSTNNKVTAKAEDEESEIESEPETGPKEIIPNLKRKLEPTSKINMKKPKLAMMTNPLPNSPSLATDESKPSAEVFDAVSLQPKKIVVNINAALTTANNDDTHRNGTSDNSIGDESAETDTAATAPLTTTDLLANRISESEMAALSVFKNYDPGLPSVKLYIKNIAKGITHDDLDKIYGKYRREDGGSDGSAFAIKLMQEGRMKGQAFVTFDSLELAQAALQETNGYVLADKPLVVVFGKMPALKS